MKDNTKLTVSGRPHQRPAHPVNTPVERASTYLFPTYDDYLEGSKAILYGRLGTPTHRALEEAVTALEGGYETRLAPSGLMACTASILAFVAAVIRHGNVQKRSDNGLKRTRPSPGGMVFSKVRDDPGAQAISASRLRSAPMSAFRRRRNISPVTLTAWLGR